MNWTQFRIHNKREREREGKREREREREKERGEEREREFIAERSSDSVKKLDFCAIAGIVVDSVRTGKSSLEQNQRYEK